MLAPVAVRNAALGGGLLPTTYQGGVNFWIGNHDGADGTYQPVSPGKQEPRVERLHASPDPPVPRSRPAEPPDDAPPNAAMSSSGAKTSRTSS